MVVQVDCWSCNVTLTGHVHIWFAITKSIDTWSHIEDKLRYDVQTSGDGQFVCEYWVLQQDISRHVLKVGYDQIWVTMWTFTTFGQKNMLFWRIIGIIFITYSSKGVVSSYSHENQFGARALTVYAEREPHSKRQGEPITLLRTSANRC